MFTDILIKMCEKCQENEELELFFEGYIESLISGCNAMYWNIIDNNNLQIIKNFFKELYYNRPELYSIKKWQPDKNHDNKEYEIRWYHSPEEAEAEKDKYDYMTKKEFYENQEEKYFICLYCQGIYKSKLSQHTRPLKEEKGKLLYNTFKICNCEKRKKEEEARCMNMK